MYNNWVRDSGCYLINEKGDKLLSYSNFTDTLLSKNISNLSTIIVDVYYKMADKDMVVTTPAGSFSTINMKGNVVVNQNGIIDNNRNINNYFAKDIGPVKSSNFYLSSSYDIVFELIGYSIN